MLTPGTLGLWRVNFALDVCTEDARGPTACALYWCTPRKAAALCFFWNRLGASGRL
jgi:hypothetical protein